MPWGALIGAAGAILGDVISSNGAQSAADTQAAGANAAANVNWNEFQQIQNMERPYLSQGYGAMNQLDYLLGMGSPSGYNGMYGTTNVPGFGYGGAGTSGQPVYGLKGGMPNYGLLPGGGAGGGATPHAGGTVGNQSVAGGFGSLLKPFTIDDFHNLSPAYQFQQQQGMQGVLNGDTSGAGALSGAAQKDLIGYNQNLANTAFGNAFNMYQTQQGNIYNRLYNLTQLGQNAAANTGQQGTALAGNIGSAYANAAAAQAAGQVGSANAWSGAVNSALPWLMKLNSPSSSYDPYAGSTSLSTGDGYVQTYQNG